MEWARDLALVLSSIGAAVFVPKILAAAWRALTGAPQRQRREIERVRDDARSADHRADQEALRRRVAQEHASHLRRLLYEAPCVDVTTIPPWPAYPDGRNADEEDS
ncbi:hypothetical protein [Microbacterium caowuchunii]|uniref:Uncharacterized protein n=1 Tax=Microbacterium caowuchunii TaxID=2614638 RepID=A0A5N0TKB4_9MICO|nr:hypothetical protein [Microbacterium caowuchunii]KAA9133769.1 hypothetical protein F6B40_08440 [Microbacterium caowuchunii]